MLIDTCIWIEIFCNSQKGKNALAMMKGETNSASILTIAEIAEWCSRSGKDPARHVKSIGLSAKILPLDVENAMAAGKLRNSLRPARKGIGMVDCLIYSSAIRAGTELLTDDAHLKGLPLAVSMEEPA